MTRFFSGFLAALFGSIVLNVIILFALRPFVINPAMPLHALSVGLIASFTAAGAIGATMVYALCRKFLARPNSVFMWISIVVLLVSFIPDYLIIGVTSGPFAGGTWPSALTLALMHVIAAITIVQSLTKLWGPKVVS